MDCALTAGGAGATPVTSPPPATPALNLSPARTRTSGRGTRPALESLL